MSQPTCAGCGDQLPPKTYQGNPRKWCSGQCRQATYRKNNPDYVARQNQIANARNRAAEKKPPKMHDLICVVCVEEFTSKVKRTMFCSDRCKYRHQYLQRRARRRGVERESFTFREIADRDQWTCGLCGMPVDQDKVYPDPHSPSLDHIKPLSHGGPHTRANVQLSHLRCNLVKGHRWSTSEVAQR